MQTRSQTRNQNLSSKNSSKISTTTNVNKQSKNSVKPSDRAYGICKDGFITHATGKGAGSHHGGV